jgi:transcriptional regulator with XRE-family HTH domain
VTIHEAVRSLRKDLGKTQQVFATELGMSISSLVNYERDRIPEPKQLCRFFWAARDAGREDLAQIFKKAILKSLGMSADQVWQVVHS